jgi:hypothetical protein
MKMTEVVDLIEAVQKLAGDETACNVAKAILRVSVSKLMVEVKQAQVKEAEANVEMLKMRDGRIDRLTARIDLARHLANGWIRMANGEEDSKWGAEGLRALDMAGHTLAALLSSPDEDVAKRLSALATAVRSMADQQNDPNDVRCADCGANPIGLDGQPDLRHSTIPGRCQVVGPRL